MKCVKYEINTNSGNLKKFLLDIKKYFKNSDDIIHKARNEIKIVKYNGKKFAVKSFKKPSLLKSIYYTKTVSKANRSYKYSLILGNLTTNPIGYIEFFKKNRLSESFFVSEYFDYNWTIRDVLKDKFFSDKQNILKEFAKFTSQLHNKNILHLDYSPGNILIKKENNLYQFKVIDINRMKFKKLLIDDRLKNFSMLWASDDDMKVIIDEYARINNINRSYAISKAIKYSFRLKLFKNFKKLIKGRFRDIDW